MKWAGRVISSQNYFKKLRLLAKVASKLLRPSENIDSVTNNLKLFKTQKNHNFAIVWATEMLHPNLEMVA